MKLAFVSALFPLLVVPGARTAAAQEPATVTGRVTSAQGQPEAAVLVRIGALAGPRRAGTQPGRAPRRRCADGGGLRPAAAQRGARRQPLR